MESARKYYREALAVILFPVIMVAESFYRQPLYSYSLDFIADWQRTVTLPNIVDFFRFVSFFGTETGLALLFGLVFCLTPRRFFLKISLVFFVSQCTYTFFKQFYHNPRPYFSSPKVRAVTCSSGYGNPSGHTVTACAVFGSLWIFIYWERRKYLIPQRWLRIVIRLLTLLLVLSLMVLTFFARMYLGVHSINHVLFGSCLGIWIAFCFTVVLGPYVDSHLDFVTKEGRQFAFTAGGIVVPAVTIVLQALNLFMYFTFKDRREFMDPDWLVQINAKCSGMLDYTSLMAEAFMGITQTTLYPLIYLSQLISSRLYPTLYKNWVTNIGYGKLAIRTLLAGAILAVCEIPYFVVSMTGAHNLAIKICIGLQLPNLLVSLVGLHAIDRLCVRFGLVGEGEADTLPNIRESARPVGGSSENNGNEKGMQVAVQGGAANGNRETKDAKNEVSGVSAGERENQ